MLCIGNNSFCVFFQNGNTLEPLSARSLPSEAVVLASWDHFVWVGLARHGLQMYSGSSNGLGLCKWNLDYGDADTSVPYIAVNQHYLVYFIVSF